MRLALAQWRIGPGRGVAGWAERLHSLARTARAKGAEMLVCPEYAPLELAAGATPDLAAELATGLATAPAALAEAREIARQTGLWLLPGTLPFASPDGPVNRAPLIAPDGRTAFQDKHVLTRFEAEQWAMRPGRPPQVFETDFGRIGIAICFDAEFPPLVRAQVEAGAWLILVPTCTDTLHGFNRVRIAAAARAMENQCHTALAPTVGAAPWSAALDENHGHAAVFGPVDRGFPATGLLAAGTLDAEQLLLADLDPAALDTVRQDGAVRNHLAWPAPPPPCPVARPQ